MRHRAFRTMGRGYRTFLGQHFLAAPGPDRRPALRRAVGSLSSRHGVWRSSSPHREIVTVNWRPLLNARRIHPVSIQSKNRKAPNQPVVVHYETTRCIMTNTVTPADALAVADLRERVQALEVGQEYDATQAAVRDVQIECLTQLRAIQAALVQDGNSTVATTAASASSPPPPHVANLQNENELLRQRNAKLEYRVQHLLASMEVLYNQARSNPGVP